MLNAAKVSYCTVHKDDYGGTNLEAVEVSVVDTVIIIN